MRCRTPSRRSGSNTHNIRLRAAAVVPEVPPAARARISTLRATLGSRAPVSLGSLRRASPRTHHAAHTLRPRSILARTPLALPAIHVPPTVTACHTSQLAPRLLLARPPPQDTPTHPCTSAGTGRSCNGQHGPSRPLHQFVQGGRPHRRPPSIASARRGCGPAQAPRASCALALARFTSPPTWPPCGATAWPAATRHGPGRAPRPPPCQQRAAAGCGSAARGRRPRRSRVTDPARRGRRGRSSRG